MNCMRSIRILIFSAIIVVIFIHNISAETFNRVVAIVNEDVITLHELNNLIQEMTGLTPEDLMSRNRNQYLETRRRVLELLIDEKITRAKIEELEIKVTSSEMDATIEKIKKNNRLTHEDLMARLRADGITYEKYREKIKKDLERFKLINFEVKSKIIIREERLREYYENHKEKFSSDGEVHLAGIFLRQKNPEDEDEIHRITKKGKDILDRLGKGEDFGELARKFSQGPGAEERGDLGNFKIAQLEPLLRKVLEDMPEGGVSDLIIKGKGIQIIKLIEKTDAKVKPFNEVKHAIYAILYGDEVDKRYVAWIKELRKSSYTKIIF